MGFPTHGVPTVSTESVLFHNSGIMAETQETPHKSQARVMTTSNPSITHLHTVCCLGSRPFRSTGQLHSEPSSTILRTHKSQNKRIVKQTCTGVWHERGNRRPAMATQFQIVTRCRGNCTRETHFFPPSQLRYTRSHVWQSVSAHDYVPHFLCDICIRYVHV